MKQARYMTQHRYLYFEARLDEIRMEYHLGLLSDEQTIAHFQLVGHSEQGAKAALRALQSHGKPFWQHFEIEHYTLLRQGHEKIEQERQRQRKEAQARAAKAKTPAK